MRLVISAVCVLVLFSYAGEIMSYPMLNLLHFHLHFTHVQLISWCSLL